VDRHGCLQDITPALLQWSHLLERWYLVTGLGLLAGDGWVMEDAVEIDDDVVVYEHVTLDEILGYEAGE
jgi:hypothetical protein